jgi:molybdate transport system substrate-binding protein
VIQKLGIADAIKAKAVITQGRPVGAAIASGEAEIGVQQIAELRPVPGVDVIGEMPADLQKQIPYSGGIAAKARDAETARALVSFLRSEAALDVLKRKGMDLP